VFASFFIASSITLMGIDTTTVSFDNDKTYEGLKFLPVNILSFPKVNPAVYTIL
jgi:hypothetical protein